MKKCITIVLLVTLLLHWSCTKEEHHHTHITPTGALDGRYHIVLEIHHDKELLSYSLRNINGQGIVGIVEGVPVDDERTLYETPYFDANLDLGNGIIYFEVTENNLFKGVAPQLAMMSDSIPEGCDFIFEEEDIEFSFEASFFEEIFESNVSVFASFDMEIHP